MCEKPMNVEFENVLNVFSVVLLNDFIVNVTALPSLIVVTSDVNLQPSEKLTDEDVWAYANIIGLVVLSEGVGWFIAFPSGPVPLVFAEC